MTVSALEANLPRSPIPSANAAPPSDQSDFASILERSVHPDTPHAAIRHAAARTLQNSAAATPTRPTSRITSTNSPKGAAPQGTNGVPDKTNAPAASASAGQPPAAQSRLRTGRAQVQAPQPGVQPAAIAATTVKTATNPASGQLPVRTNAADGSAITSEAGLGAGIQSARTPPTMPQASVALTQGAGTAADILAPAAAAAAGIAAEASAAGLQSAGTGQSAVQLPTANGIPSGPPTAETALAAGLQSEESGQSAVQSPAANGITSGTATAETALAASLQSTGTGQSAAQSNGTSPAASGTTAEAALAAGPQSPGSAQSAVQSPAASTQGQTEAAAAAPAPIAPPVVPSQAAALAPSLSVAAAPTSVVTPARAAGPSTTSSGTVRSSSAAPSGTGLAQPALLVAVQAQEQAPQSPDAAPNPATTVNAAAPGSDQTDGVEADADAADPAAAFADQGGFLVASAEPVPLGTSAAPTAVTGSVSDRKATTGELTAAGVPAHDPTAPSGTASPVAAGPAAATTAPLDQATGAAPGTPAGPTTPATLPAVQLAMAITRNAAAAGGAQSFTLQLKPNQLGTVDVKLDVDAKGHATASFVADHPDTLALLRQDAHHLVKSLNDAGVSTDAGSLNFSLRNSGGGFAEAQERRSSTEQALRNTGSGSPSSAAAEPIPPVTQSSGTSRLYDLRA